jgi:tetratricopeptide (TPR) repeat protein
MEEGIKMLETAIQIATEANNTTSKGIYLHNLGNIYRDLKKYDEAIQTLQQALDVAQQSDPSKQAVRLNAIGLCYLKAQNFAKAVEYLTQALTLAESTHNQKLEACILHNIAAASQNSGNTKE